MVVQIDGEKLLTRLHLNNVESLTAEMVRNALCELSLEELQEFHIVTVSTAQQSHNYTICTRLQNSMYDKSFIDNDKLRKLIKYERNPMKKAELQRILSQSNFCKGKHYKGKRH